jgi:hypothetical protein
MRYLIAFVLLWPTLSDAASKSCESSLRSRPIHTLISEITRKSLDESITVRLRVTGDTHQLKAGEFAGIQEVWEKRYPIEVKTISSAAADRTDIELRGQGRDIVHALLELSPESLSSVSWLVAPIPKKREPVLDGSDFVNADILKRILLIPIYRLDLNRRAKACLANDAVVFVGDLIRYTAGRVSRIPGMGERSLQEIENKLANLQLRLNMHVESWPPDDLGTFTQALGRRPTDKPLNLSDWDELTVGELTNIFDSRTTGLSPKYPQRLIAEDGQEPLFAVMRLNHFTNTGNRELSKEIAGQHGYASSLAPQIFARLRTWKQDFDLIKMYPADRFVGASAKKLFRDAETSKMPFIVVPPETLRDEMSLIVLPLP